MVCCSIAIAGLGSHECSKTKSAITRSLFFKVLSGAFPFMDKAKKAIAAQNGKDLIG
jgi:hypothetical protein